ncbi:MAG TPA: cobalamin biosynthesis protein [Micromonosporaceae bacterium]
MVVAQVAGLAAGVLADIALGDPRRFHPVAGFGQAASRLERRVYAPTRAAGVRFAGVAVGLPVAGAIGVTALTARRPVLRGIAIAATTWAVLGGTSLRREATAMASDLAAPDGLVAARRRLPNLVGRDPSALDRPEIARATVESVAENTSDAQVAPLFWGAVAGLPGLVGYRAINTLDAMVGHRSPRYRDFGTAAARLDDVANLIPSRLTALLTAATATPAGGDGAAALATWWRDGDRHPSPNSGQCEAAMAGALGVRLGGRNVYHGRVEDRPWLGSGPLPRPTDVWVAARISGAVGLAALAVCGATRLAVGLRRRDRPTD